MTKRQRLDAVFAGETPDRPPVLGGWIANPGALAKISGKTLEDYNKNPEEVAISAYKTLDMDGIIAVFVTKDADTYRCVDEHSYARAQVGMSYEEVEREVEGLPEPDDYEKQFCFGDEYAAYIKHLTEIQLRCGDVVYMPARWNAGAHASWFLQYGYENFFMLIALRPDLAAKLFRIGGAMGRFQSRLVAQAVKEGLFPKALLMGEDLCSQRGSMISVRFLEEHYAPALSYGLEPLLEAGCKPVWHSDGDVREIMPMLLSCGIQGFQGFQPECGMRLDDIVKMRTREGEKLLIFGPLAVTTELPVLSPAEIRARVRHYAEVCRGNADLVFFTSNTINPDVPLENLLAMYDEIRRCK